MSGNELDRKRAERAGRTVVEMLALALGRTPAISTARLHAWIATTRWAANVCDTQFPSANERTGR